MTIIIHKRQFHLIQILIVVLHLDKSETSSLTLLLPVTLTTVYNDTLVVKGLIMNLWYTEHYMTNCDNFFILIWFIYYIIL